MTEIRQCPRCKGVGTRNKGYGDNPTEQVECHGCNGAKEFQAPDLVQIVQAVTTGRGMKDGKRKFRASMTTTGGWSDTNRAREYYVWRMARFAGGKDMSMPWNAGLVIRDDPFKPELEALADALAKKVFGSDRRAALRWGRAMGMEIPTQPDDNLDTLFGSL